MCGTLKRGNMEDKHNTEVNAFSNLHTGKALFMKIKLAYKTRPKLRIHAYVTI